MATFVRAASLTNFHAVATGLGLDAHAMLKEFGIPAKILSNPESRLETGRVVALLEAGAQRSGNSSFALNMAQGRPIANLGALSLLLIHEATLREVITTLRQYRQLSNQALTLSVNETGKEIVVQVNMSLDRECRCAQAYELSLASLVRLIQWFLGEQWRPSSVRFAHEPHANILFHRHFFGENLHFGADAYEVYLTSSDYQKPNPNADVLLAHHARHLIDALPLAGAGSVVEDARSAISQLLPSCTVTMERVAARLGLHPRTMQRRLSDADVSFSDLVHQVRKDQAMQLMANRDISMLELGALLGYSQSSAFTRWFVSQFGCPPSRYRSDRLYSKPSIASFRRMHA